MNRTFALALAVCAGTGCANTFAPTDAERLVGTWVVMDFQSPGAKEDRSQRRKCAVVSEGTWAQQFRGDQFEDFEYTLDTTKSPKHIDLTYTDARGKRLTVRGIYELTSDDMGDRLRLCLGSPPVREKDGKPEYVESARPTAFAPTAGALISYRRKSE
ncbi:MAG: TIGR03067 domain-containing protein [Planctomycetes bacterium]|nr:TIGR03067 domain-containing protein [Planctomycetota bacterium]